MVVFISPGTKLCSNGRQNAYLYVWNLNKRPDRVLLKWVEWDDSDKYWKYNKDFRVTCTGRSTWNLLEIPRSYIITWYFRKMRLYADEGGGAPDMSLTTVTTNCWKLSYKGVKHSVTGALYNRRPWCYWFALAITHDLCDQSRAISMSFDINGILRHVKESRYVFKTRQNKINKKFIVW